MSLIFKEGPDLLVRTRDGRNFTLMEDKHIVSDTAVIYRMSVGTTSDGASIPQELWSTGLAPFGPYWPACFAHDLAYRNTLLRLENSFWVPAMLSRDDSDSLLLDLMTALCVPALMKEAIYEGVRIGGAIAFGKDRAA